MNRGFTLIELLLVIGGILLIFALTVPISLQFFQSQTLDETAQNVVNYIEQAHIQAIAGKGDSPHGVYIQIDSLTLFEGDTYVSRNQTKDFLYTFPIGIISASTSEIIFKNVTGEALLKEDIILQQGNTQTRIDTNGIGSVYVE